MKLVFVGLVYILPILGFLAHGLVGLGLGLAITALYLAISKPALFFALFQRGSKLVAETSTTGGNREILIDSTMSLLGEMATADGLVSEREREAVNHIIDHVLKLSAREKKRALETFQKTSLTGAPIALHTKKVIEAYGDNIEALSQGLIKLLLKVATADGRISSHEEHLIASVASQVGIADRELELMISPYRSLEESEMMQSSRSMPLNPQSRNLSLMQESKSLEDEYTDTDRDLEAEYAVLGCDYDASEEVIIRCYNELKERYDVERLFVNRAPQQQIDDALLRSAEIEEAFQRIREFRVKTLRVANS